MLIILLPLVYMSLAIYLPRRHHMPPDFDTRRHYHLLLPISISDCHRLLSGFPITVADMNTMSMPVNADISADNG